MTTYSRVDLATTILLDEGLIGAEETPSAIDLDWAYQKIDTVVPLITALDLPIWNGSEFSIPPQYMPVLSEYIGTYIARSYGEMGVAEAIAAREALERTLVVLASPRGAKPLLAKTNDSTRRNSSYDWSTGR